MKLKIAILEDSQLLLKDLKQNLEDTGLVEVIAWARTSDEFMEKIKHNKPEALFLDIDLGNNSRETGLDIANALKLPVVFVSGKTKEFLQSIEELYINSDMPVAHLSKPISIEKLKKILPKFINELRAIQNTQFIYLDFGEMKRNKIAIDTIAYLCTDKANGAESNNKLIFFTNKKPEILIDFSFTKMEEKGLSKNKFIIIHKSFRVNAEKIQYYDKNTHEIGVEVFKLNEKTEIKMLHVSENYRNEITKFKK